ncbi:hypothetical protein HY489_03305 [Candidatus Woesearchaeota archaeon]|nr:hypothetical protein [Candidatus Woesearchaeota archaeon]
MKAGDYVAGCRVQSVVNAQSYEVIDAHGAVRLLKQSPDADLESRVIAKLDHVNIPVVCSPEDGALILSPSGRFLDDFLASGALRVDETVPIVGQVLDALCYAHGKGVYHGDVRAGNVWLQGSRVLLGGWKHSPRHLDESFDEGVVGVKQDLVGVGKLLYHCLAGELPDVIAGPLDGADELFRKLVLPAGFQSVREAREYVEELENVDSRECNRLRQQVRVLEAEKRKAESFAIASYEPDAAARLYLEVGDREMFAGDVKGAVDAWESGFVASLALRYRLPVVRWFAGNPYLSEGDKELRLELAYRLVEGYLSLGKIETAARAATNALTVVEHSNCKDDALAARWHRSMSRVCAAVNKADYAAYHEGQAKKYETKLHSERPAVAQRKI